MMDRIARKSSEVRKAIRKGCVLFLETDSGIIRIWPQTERIIRVSYTEQGCFPTEEPENYFPGGQGEQFIDLSARAEHAGGNIAQEENRTAEDTDWQWEETTQEICIRTAALTVRVDRGSGAVCYEKKDGVVLLRETDKDSKQLEAFDTYRTLENDQAQMEEIQTPDGVKRRILAADRVFDRVLYHTKISFSFQPEEILFGLGQAEEGMWNLRHTTQYLHQANRKIALPVLLSDRQYGILLSTQSPAIFEDSQYGSYLYTEADEYLDYYFLAGEPAEVVRGIRRLTGRAVMLPKWAFGYFQSKERYETAEEIEETALQFRQTGFGMDAIVLDWMSWPDGLWGQKSFDPGRFPDPAYMVWKLHGMSAHLMMSIWPNMDEKCQDYQEFQKAGLLLPNSNIYDAFSEEGRRLYWKQVQNALFVHGVDAWWCDSSEPLTPEWSRKKQPPAGEMYRMYVEESSKIMPLERANAYGLCHARAIYEGQRGQTDQRRVVNLTRNGYLGSQQYGTILWSGDISADWETLQRQITAGLQFCSCGLPYWTLDIGAFFVGRGSQWFWDGDYEKGTEDPGYRELYVRWFQYGAFLPVFRSHGTDCAREPWQFGKKGEPFYDALLAADRLRYRLLPYIYSLAGAVWREDALMMQPLVFGFPEDKKAAEISQQFLFGPSLMVCPVTEPILYQAGGVPVRTPKKTKQVYLPKGADWYDFYTGEKYAGGQEISVELCLEHIPLFVRAGAILPTTEPGLSTAHMEGQDITLLIYPGADGHFCLYEDAGDGYDYEQGDCCVTDIFWDESRQAVSWETKGNPEFRRGEFHVQMCGI